MHENENGKDHHDPEAQRLIAREMVESVGLTPERVRRCVLKVCGPKPRPLTLRQILYEARK